MAKDKFDYCAMDDTLNILCRGSNKENRKERFKELSDLIRTLKSTGTMMKIGTESTGIYHIPLYNHLRTGGFPVRILNGLRRCHAVRKMCMKYILSTVGFVVKCSALILSEGIEIGIRQEKENGTEKDGGLTRKQKCTHGKY